MDIRLLGPVVQKLKVDNAIHNIGLAIQVLPI